MLSLRGQSDGQCGAFRLDCLPGLGRCGGLHFCVMHLTYCNVNTLFLPYLPVLLVPLSQHRATLFFSTLVGRLISRSVLPRGWYARSLLPSWGRRCVLIIPGGGSTYAPGRRQSPPSPTRSRGLPVGTWGLLIIRYVCVAILPSVYYNNEDEGFSGVEG